MSSIIPPYKPPPIRTVADYQREASYQDALDRATNSGAYGPPGTGPHFHLGHVLTGLGLAFLTWILAPLVGLHEFMAFPALIVGIIGSGMYTNRDQSKSRDESSPWVRKRKGTGFFVVAGALSWAGLGVWFAVSEGDIPIVQAAVTFAIIGAVVGLVIALMVKVFRALTGRRAT